MATVRGGACPESQTIQRNLAMIVDRITKSAGPLWLSQKLQEEGFISAQRAADILNTLGTSSSDKVSSMMEAVESRIKSDSKPSQPFGNFIEVLQSEPSLQDVVGTLDAYYQDILKSDDSESDDRAPLLTTPERNEAKNVNKAASSHQKQIHARHSMFTVVVQHSHGIGGGSFPGHTPRRVWPGNEARGVEDLLRITDNKPKDKDNCCPIISIESPLCICSCFTAAMTACLMITVYVVTCLKPNLYGLKVKRSLKRGTIPSKVTPFTFLWTVFPTVLLFALIISTYSRSMYLKRRLSPSTHLYTFVTVFIYSTALVAAAWKLESDSGLMMVSAIVNKRNATVTDYVLCGFFLMQYIRIFLSVFRVLSVRIQQALFRQRLDHFGMYFEFRQPIQQLYVLEPAAMHSGRFCRWCLLLGIGLLTICVIYLSDTLFLAMSAVIIAMKDLLGFLTGCLVVFLVGPPVSTMGVTYSRALSFTKVIAVAIPALCLCVLYFVIDVVHSDDTLLDVGVTGVLTGAVVVPVILADYFNQ